MFSNGAAAGSKKVKGYKVEPTNFRVGNVSLA